MQSLFLPLGSEVYCPWSVSTEATPAACTSERPGFYSWEEKSYEAAHRAVPTSTSLNPDLVLWAWSLHACDVQDNIEIWALNVYSENGT